MHFDEGYWLEAIKHPNWYIKFNQFANKAKLKTQADSPEQTEFNKQIRHFFEKALADGKVRIGSKGHDFDSERLPVDTIVIHHTSAKPGYKLSYLDAVHLLNIYVPAYSSGSNHGRSIWSGHFKDGQQIFWGYHWLMRMDGSFENLLKDNQIGWHAGNWNINQRSVGICLDNDYERQDPTDEILRKLAKFINQKYPKLKIIGHCEAREGTSCPGRNFIDGWKNQLLNVV